MAERQPPPSPTSTPASGLSRKEDLKRKSGSGADADADADQAKKPKPAPWRGGLRLIDADADADQAKKPRPAPWRGGLRLIDLDPVWGKPVQEDEEPASSGDERPLGVDYGSGRVMVASPEEQGGSTRYHWGGAKRKQSDAGRRGVSPPSQRQWRQDTASSRGIDEEDLWHPRKDARHISVEPRDISSSWRRMRHDSEKTRPRRHRHDLEEPEDEMMMFVPQDPSLAVERAKAVFRDKEGAQIISEEDMRKAKEPEKSKEMNIERVIQKREAEARLRVMEAEKSNRFARIRDFPEHGPIYKNKIRWNNPVSDLVKVNYPEFILEDTGNNKMKESCFILSQNTPTEIWLNVGVDPPNCYGIKPDRHWDGMDRSYDAYMKFVYGSRSKREGKIWHCACKATNFPKRKLVFGLPKFHCGCGKKFLEENDLDFCLADIRVNYELVVSRIFDQDGPSCMENACCQAMLISHTMDCIIRDTEVKKQMMNIDPGEISTAYLDKYPKMGQGSMSSIDPSSVHKFIKMALMLKNTGIKLEDDTFWRIGDISFIAKDDYKTICEELANGVPLLAVITPGVNFKYLEYCEVYRPPLLQDFHDCNNFHKKNNHRTVHEAHMVVLIGHAFKAKGKNPGRAYYFLNSHEMWCKRKVIDNTHELAPDIKKPMDYGIGKIEEKGLVYSVIKLWKFGETAGPDSIKLEDEDEAEANKYRNKISNRQKFTGQYPSSPKSMKEARSKQKDM